MKNTAQKFIPFLSLVLLFTSCVTVRQGTVGVKRTIGKIDTNIILPGPKLYNPFVSKVIIVPTRTENIEVRLQLPSKEGLNVNAEISILYHIDQAQATNIVGEIGMSYEDVIILPVFRAAAADVTAKYMAKDMHTGNRFEIEQSIKNQMLKIIGERGFVIEAVLLKSIQLPARLYQSIEEKLQAEQDAQRMEFILDQEKQKAKQRILEAEGIRDANKIISEGLTPQIIQFKTLEAYRELSKSPNTKIIIGSGSQPIIMEP